MSNKDREYHPRLSVDITVEQFKRVQRLVPWGQKGRLISSILDDVLTAIERYPGEGEIVIAAILSKKVSIIDIIKAVHSDGKV